LFKKCENIILFINYILISTILFRINGLNYFRWTLFSNTQLL
jgi:hypothetical protein